MKLRSVALSQGDQLPTGKLRSTWRIQGHRLGMLVEELEEGVPLWTVTAECGDYYCGCGVGHLLAICTSEDAAYEQRKLFDSDLDAHGHRKWEYVEVEALMSDVPLTPHSVARYTDPPKIEGKGRGPFVSAPRSTEGPFCAVGAITQSLKEGGAPHDAGRTGVRDVLHRLRVDLAHRLGR